jgi:hypothetical protein
MLVRSSNVVELRPHYIGPELRGSWVWYIDVGSVPSPAQCHDVAVLFAQFDRGPFGGGIIGFRAFRSRLTTLDTVECRSVDPAGPDSRAFLNARVGHEGLLADIGVCSTAAPLVDWFTLPNSPRARGRTYLLGCGQTVFSTTDPNRLDTLAAASMRDLFNLWIAALPALGLGQMVLLSFRADGIPFPDSPISLVVDCELRAGFLGSQRRRRATPSPIG